MDESDSPGIFAGERNPAPCLLFTSMDVRQVRCANSEVNGSLFAVRNPAPVSCADSERKIRLDFFLAQPLGSRHPSLMLFSTYKKRVKKHSFFPFNPGIQ